MNKLFLIIKREYLTRIQKRSFLLITVICPALIYLLLMGVRKINENQKVKFNKVIIVEQRDYLFSGLTSIAGLKTEYADIGLAEIKKRITENQNIIVLYVSTAFKNTHQIEIYSSNNIDGSILNAIQNQLQYLFLDESLKKSGTEINGTRLSFKENTLFAGAYSNVKTLGTIGILLATLVFLSIFMYSNQVMRGVIEEKSSRIVEIIISSVKPFELMLGKVVGVGMVGITQFLLWICIAYFGINYFKVFDINFGGLLSGIKIPYSMPVIIAVPFAYFIGGYFLYSALFAAVGSMIDNESESQQFVVPVTAPLIFTLMLAQTAILNDPNGNIAYWLSVIPFTSPIAMMVRFPMGVPVHQIILSLALLLICFVLITWVSSKIYKNGILANNRKSWLWDIIKGIDIKKITNR